MLIKEDNLNLNSCNAVLSINNVGNVFSNVNGASEQVEFPLNVVKKDNYFTFELKEDLYVNKNTLLLSSNKQTNYIKTKHIYLPVNDYQNQEKYHATIVLNRFGINNDMLFHRFELRANKNTIGDCHNSKYCIIWKNYRP